MQRDESGIQPPLTEADALQYVENSLGHKIDVLRIFPKYVYIEPINQCNARCTMCGIDFKKKKKEFLSEELFEKIVRELSQYAEYLERVGLYVDCEPLLDPDLAHKIEKLKKIGIRKTYLNSNASLMDSERAEELIRAGLDMIYITIDSMVPERYESIRRGLKFDNVYRNTVEFIRLRDKLNPNLMIRIQMILQDINRDEAEAFLEHWKPMASKIDQVTVRQPHNWGSAIDIEVPEDKKLINRFPCIALWSTLGIHSNGDVNLCCIDFANSVPLGNVRQQSIAEIWRGDKLRQIRQIHLQGKRAKISICNGCPVWFERVGWRQECRSAD